MRLRKPKKDEIDRLFEENSDSAANGKKEKRKLANKKPIKK